MFWLSGVAIGKEPWRVLLTIKLNGTFKIRFDIGIRCRESHKRHREFLMTLILGPRFLPAMGACYIARLNVSFSGEPEAHVEQTQSMRRSLRKSLPHNRRQYGKRNHCRPFGKINLYSRCLSHLCSLKREKIISVRTTLDQLIKRVQYKKRTCVF